MRFMFSICVCMIDVFARGVPDKVRIHMLLDPLEGDEALARAGGMVGWMIAACGVLQSIAITASYA